jgi:hypothetical protein
LLEEAEGAAFAEAEETLDLVRRCREEEGVGELWEGVHLMTLQVFPVEGEEDTPILVVTQQEELLVAGMEGAEPPLMAPMEGPMAEEGVVKVQSADLWHPHLRAEMEVQEGVAEVREELA